MYPQYIPPVNPPQVRRYPNDGSSAPYASHPHPHSHPQHRANSTPGAYYTPLPSVPPRPTPAFPVPQLPPSLMPGFTSRGPYNAPQPSSLFFERNRAYTTAFYHPAGFAAPANSHTGPSMHAHDVSPHRPALPPKISLNSSLPPTPESGGYAPPPLPPRITSLAYDHPAPAPLPPKEREVSSRDAEHLSAGPASTVDTSLARALALSVETRSASPTRLSQQEREDAEFERALHESLNISKSLAASDSQWEEYDPRQFESHGPGPARSPTSAGSSSSSSQATASSSSLKSGGSLPSENMHAAFVLHESWLSLEEEDELSMREESPTSITASGGEGHPNEAFSLPRYEEAVASGPPSRNSSLTATVSAPPPHQSSLASSPQSQHIRTPTPTPPAVATPPAPMPIDLRPPSPPSRSTSAPANSTLAEVRHIDMPPAFHPESNSAPPTQRPYAPDYALEPPIMEPWSPPQDSTRPAGENPGPSQRSAIPADPAEAGTSTASSSTTSLGPLSATDMVEESLLIGVSLGFNAPIISNVVSPMQGPIPNIISLPYGKCPPMHIQAPSWRQLLKLMARMSTSRIEPTVEAMALVKTEMKLRIVVQFVKLHPSSPDWRTILYLSIDHPVPPNLPHGYKYTNGDVNTLPFSYTLSQLPTLLRDGPDSMMTKRYTIPHTNSTPYPTLPIDVPNLAMYLQSALDDSRRAMNDSSSGLRKLAKLVDGFYPSDEGGLGVLGQEAEVERSRIGRGILKAFGKSNKNTRDRGRGGNADTYEFITPFRLDEWG